MAKQIIILDVIPGPGVGFKYALWAVVPASRQSFYVTTVNSAWTNASTAENTAIKAGQVAELVGSQIWPAGTTIASIKTVLQAAFTAWQATVNGRNEWTQYGTFFDGTTSTWTQGGVA